MDGGLHRYGGEHDGNTLRRPREWLTSNVRQVHRFEGAGRQGDP